MSKKSSKGSKNDMTNRGKKAALRLFNGLEVEPVQFVSKDRGKYMAGRYKDKTKGDGLIVDAAGVPIPYGRFQEQN
jgi:hypothetical protein